MIKLIKKGDVAALAALMDGRGGDKMSLIGFADMRGWQPIHHAALANNAEIVALLLENGASVDATTNENSTALHICAYNNCVEAAKIFLSASCDISTRNADGETAFDIAKAKNRSAILSLLQTRQDKT